MSDELYTTQLQAGLGLIDETRVLLDLWQPGMSSVRLQKIALELGPLPNVSARRLRNIIAECFAPRYLKGDPIPGEVLKRVKQTLSASEFEQQLFIYTCRANLILADFIRQVYWDAYSAGRNTLGGEEAERFVIRANQDGKTRATWSDTTIRRVSGYLVGCCVDFKLLDAEGRSNHKILPFKLESRLAVLLAYDLHFAGFGDNNLLIHPDWSLFGMDREDVMNEIKRLALKGWFMIQAAGETIRISWAYTTREEFMDAYIKG